MELETSDSGHLDPLAVSRVVTYVPLLIAMDQGKISTA